MDNPLIIIAIFLLAGLIQGLSGFGAGLIAMPLLCLFLDVKTAVPLCILNSLIITGYLIIRLNNHIHFKKAFPLWISSIPGIYLGASLLTTLNEQLMTITLGVLLILYSVYALVTAPQPRKIKPVWGYFAGFSSGAIGAAFGAGGPPTIIYTTLNDWTKDEVKATLTAFFAFNSVLTAIVHAVSGLTTPYVLKQFLISAPAVFVGTVCGSMLYSKLPRELFIQVVFCFLILMGLTMLIFH